MFENNLPWKIYKRVLPQHTDHAGVMWHGAYLNWLEESRIQALLSTGINYQELSLSGFELPVVKLTINYQSSIFHGEEICLETSISRVKGLRIPFETKFIKEEKIIAAVSSVDIVLVKKNNGVITLVRDYPEFFKKSLERLNKVSAKNNNP